MTASEIKVQMALGTFSRKMFRTEAATSYDPKVISFLFNSLSLELSISDEVLAGFYNNPHTPQTIKDCISQTMSINHTCYYNLNAHFQHYYQPGEE